MTLRGFRSYAAEQTFDFRGRRLVGVVGPIGSGKSSLLDAVAFALYGKTPTFERDTRSLVHQRADAAHVELWFEVDGQPWRAVRVLRVQGQAAHALYRHETSDPTSARVEEVTGARAVTERVERLLGLDFAAFRRSTLLAQNQFAEFLRAAPAERDAVLKGVFGFDRVEAMQAVAKARRDAAARDLEELERRRREIEEDRLRLEAARLRSKETTERAALFDEAAAAVAAADAEIAAARAAHQEARARRASLDELAGQLPGRARADALVAAAQESAAAVAAAAQEADEGQAARQAAESALEAALATVGGRSRLEAARIVVARLGDRRDAVAAAERRVSAAEAAHAAAGEDVATAAADAAAADSQRAVAERTLAGAREALALAREAWHEARHADAAAELRSTLAAGEDCPVCGQTVATLPKRGRRPGLATLEKAVGKAEREEAKAAAQHAAATEAAAAAASTAAVAAERLATTAAAVTSRKAELADGAAAVEEAAGEAADLLGDGDPGELLAAAETAVAAADQALAAARAAEQAAAERAAAARERRAATADELASLATDVAALAGRLGSDVAVPADPDGVAAALARVRELWQSEAAAVDQAASDASEAANSAAAQRATLLEALELAPDADFATARRQAASDAAAVAKEVELLEERVARFGELERENAAAVAGLATYRRLADDLAPARFLRFLLEEERQGLADLGSDRFELLSGGRYRFTTDGTFGIVDLAAAEAERRPESLSGGETFLASLALALALAEMVTRSGGRLDAFFLDEGFGSLDRDHLDLAMEGIERLVADSPDRLVVVVSHVLDMRHRIEDLIELDRDPVTGATRVVRA